MVPSSLASNQFAHKASPILCPLRPWRRNWPNLQGLVNKLKNGRWPTERLSVSQRPFPIYKGYSSTYENIPLYIGNGDRKSTRLNSSHVAISYAVFCLKKK